LRSPNGESGFGCGEIGGRYFDECGEGGVVGKGGEDVDSRECEYDDVVGV
jgi:hypothetical protein